MSLHIDSVSLEFAPSKTNEMNAKDLIFSSTENNKDNPTPPSATLHKASDEEEMLETSVEQSLVSHKNCEILRHGVNKARKGKLLVLDLNGILCDIVCVVPKAYKPDKKFKAKSVFKRPYCDDFLKFCFERFDVGVWSSRTKKNVDNLVDFLMGDMRHHLLFCWDSSQCTKTGFRSTENRHKPVVLKELKKLWEKEDTELPWEKGDYNKSNTLLLDDSPYKAIRNPPYTAVLPCSFTLYHQDDNSLDSGGDLRMYLGRLAMAEDVQKFIEENPFGQSQTNPNLDFHNRVIL